MPTRRARSWRSIAGAFAVLVACGAETGDGSAGSAANGQSTAPSADTIVIDATGTSHNLTCEGRNVEVSGLANRVELHGHCPTVTVSGSANSVLVDRADRLVATGSANKITWRSGITGAEPEIENPGMANVIGQGRTLR